MYILLIYVWTYKLSYHTWILIIFAQPDKKVACVACIISGNCYDQSEVEKKKKGKQVVRKDIKMVFSQYY